MKSFSQFLQESYLSEEPAGRPARRRKPSKSVEQLKADIDEREAKQAAKKAQRKPSGAATRSDLQFKTSKVGSPATSAPEVTQTNKIATQTTQPDVRPSTSSGQYRNPTLSPTSRVQTTAGTSTSQSTKSQQRSNTNIPSRKPGESTEDLAARRKAATQQRMRQSSSTIVPAGKPSSSAIVPAGKPPAGPKIKVPSGLAKAGRVAGKVLGPAAAALDVADEKSKGSGWARSLAKGAVVAAGGALGGAAGSVAGPVGSIGGATAGSMAASKAFDVAAGANAKERKAMATANRQRQAGTAIKGIGGKTTFDTKKNTMTTGTGSQKKTVGLAKTGVVQRGGQSVAGHLAYKGGKAVYKAGPSAQSLAKTSSNPLERIGRSLFAGAYKQHDAAKAKQALSKARQSDAARNKALGVKALPGK